MTNIPTKFDRRALLGGAAVVLGAAALPAFAQVAAPDPAADAGPIRNNISSFRMLDWQPYFTNTKKGAILVDISSRALHFWSEDQSIYSCCHSARSRWS